MARLVGINHVALEVDDVDAALAWYGRFFEFELRGRAGARMAFIDMGDQFIAIAAGRSQAPDEARHFGLVVDDKEAVRAALRHDGVEVRAFRARSTSATRGATTCRSSTTARSSSPRQPGFCAAWAWTSSERPNAHSPSSETRDSPASGSRLAWCIRRAIADGVRSSRQPPIRASSIDTTRNHAIENT